MKVRFSVTVKNKDGESQETSIKVEQTLLNLLAIKFGGQNEAKLKMRELAQTVPRNIRNFSATVCNLAILEISDKKLRKEYADTYGQVDWVG